MNSYVKLFFAHRESSENLMMCQGSNFRRRGGERQRGRCFAAIEWPNALRQHRKTKMTAWQQAIRSLDAIGLSDKKRVISTLRVVCPIAGGRLFLAIYKKIVRLQSWRYLLRVAKSGAKGDGFISLTVDIVSELLLGTQNTPDNVTVLYFFTCFGRR